MGVYAIQRLWYILAYLLAVFFYIYWPWGLIQYREMEHIQLCTVCTFVQRVAANELEKKFHLNYHSLELHAEQCMCFGRHA